MNIHLFAVAFVLFVGLASGCDSAGVEPELDVQPEIERSSSKSIVREADNAFEASLIALAEAAYPPRESVVAAAGPWLQDRIPQTGYWYYSSFDGVYIPYALTGDAVDYYSGLIDALEAGERLQFLTKAELTYRAVVTFEEAYTFEGEDPMTHEPLPAESFQRVYVVNLSLEWYQHCGSLCAMWIDHERIAVFDEGGELLRVFLDGPRSVAVS